MKRSATVGARSPPAPRRRSRRLLHGHARGRRLRGRGGGARRRRRGVVDLQRHALGRDLAAPSAERLAGLDLRRAAGASAGCPRSRARRVALAARGTRATTLVPGAQRDIRQLGAQQRGTTTAIGSMHAYRMPQGVGGRSPDGMDRGLYIAASGMLAEQVRQDQIANDLANASTSGYKADRTTQQTFGDLLLQQLGDRRRRSGRQSTAVQVDKIVTDFTAAAAQGHGRAARLRDRRRRLLRRPDRRRARATRATASSPPTPRASSSTAAGDPVLGRNGQPVTLGADGTRRPARAQRRRRSTTRASRATTSSPAPPAGQPATGTVRSGALEGSGADADPLDGRHDRRRCGPTRPARRSSRRSTRRSARPPARSARPVADPARSSPRRPVEDTR